MWGTACDTLHHTCRSMVCGVSCGLCNKGAWGGGMQGLVHVSGTKDTIADTSWSPAPAHALVCTALSAMRSGDLVLVGGSSLMVWSARCLINLSLPSLFARLRCFRPCCLGYAVHSLPCGPVIWCWWWGLLSWSGAPSGSSKQPKRQAQHWQL